MNIVLLSGGSGKRLWPLSNDVKSKQFIKLFKRDDGGYESMLERVFRQIKSADSASKITIAAGEVQVPLIREQLGESVSISIEPSRRDTFPAIALAALYLYEKNGCSLEEPVIVAPVDPYVDDSYYLSFKELERIAMEGNSRLTLMGITPTYPSEKYGYIIPEGKEKISKVRTFKEKPDKKKAEEYMEEGALWNAGVFAFKLGYLIEIAHKYIDFNGYDDLFEKYPHLEKISFDYAVVEKEDDITVLRYDGRWEDVGTWNTLSDVLDNDTIGNVIKGEDNHNLTVINSLDIPILCMGSSDMIVVASEDGILVSEKAMSSRIKSAVESIEPREKNGITLISRDESSLIYRLKLKEGEAFKFPQSPGWFLVNIIRGEASLIKNGSAAVLRGGGSLKIEKEEASITALSDIEVVITASPEAGSLL